MEWAVTDLWLVRSDGGAICAAFHLSELNPRTRKAYPGYRIHVYDDGSWNAFRLMASGWREVNGVSEDVDPLFRATLPKAQALVLLKG